MTTWVTRGPVLPGVFGASLLLGVHPFPAKGIKERREPGAEGSGAGKSGSELSTHAPRACSSALCGKELSAKDLSCPPSLSDVWPHNDQDTGGGSATSSLLAAARGGAGGQPEAPPPWAAVQFGEMKSPADGRAVVAAQQRDRACALGHGEAGSFPCCVHFTTLFKNV